MNIMLKHILKAILILAFFANFSIGGECEEIGGTCLDWRYNVCHGGVETGLCPGDTNVRCCHKCDYGCEHNEAVWSGHDGACTAAGGECKLDSNYCAGSYEGGLCGGPQERKCCKEATHGKVYERCEFARELVDLHGFDFGTLGNWVCLAQYESSYNTAATNDNTNGSRDYGIFQINDNYWCDANVGAGADCGMTCTSFLDSVLADDVTCAKIIYNRHGFEAWYGWINNCKNTNVAGYVSDCF
eukprot:TRINITY_DN14963_c0_g1_i2.p1 TRINITY_DN14963_c0_g1~~TRINITY_DN14963_c0_g1_i2.p1  ORF type:complete len:243 (-),score=48.51 TRINITY_DN14963_c0_g1_i2:58-786(-)